MLSALAERPELAGLTPFAALFYGTPSTYVFYDEEGRAHDVQQGEGGEQGDPLMPSLFGLGQHHALVEARARLHPSNTLYAFLDDIYAAGQFAIVREAHPGASGQNTRGGAPGTRSTPAGGNWAIPAAQQGVVVLGSPIGSREFLATKLAERLEEHPACAQPAVGVVTPPVLRSSP